MSYVANKENSGKVSWQQGAIGGIVLAVVTVILDYLASQAGLGWLNIVSWLVWVAGLFAVGYLAAQKTGLARTGTMAGFWAGLVGGLINFFVTVLLALTVNTAQIDKAIKDAAAQAGSDPDAVRVATIIVFVLGFLLIAAIQAGLGAGLGALGGLLGRNKAGVETTVPPYPQQ